MRITALALLLAIGCAHRQRQAPPTCQNRPAWPDGCAFEELCDQRGICL